MKYYSEQTKTFYDSQEECLQAEASLKKSVQEKEEKKQNDLTILQNKQAEVIESEKHYEAALKARNEALQSMREEALKFYNSYGSIPNKYRSYLPFGSFFLPYV